ncbi:MAG TPA: electron transport complex subunit RsxC [Firmicutes bacterium]|nr:electron transport complex subunit RsxC [Bacillota bacterium]
MSKRSFAKGIHPGYFKDLSSGKQVASARAPAQVIIPMHQNIGAPCEPVVQVGDEVKLGQKIGEPKGFVSAPVFASVSGKVTRIEPFNHPLGNPVLAVFIENDGLDTPDEGMKPREPLEALSAKEIIQISKDAGLVGLGGATFPTHVKLSPPPETSIDTVIINGAECEPFLTADHRQMVERADDIVYGLKGFMKALGAAMGIIGIEDNKPDAVVSMEKAVAEGKGDYDLVVYPLHTKYPQGAEKMLIKATTGRDVPTGALPMAVSVVNQNSGTAIALAEAIKLGKPLYERVVTVTGPGIKEPANLLVRNGTLVKDLIEQCGGMTDDARKLILGGPMMGLAQPGDTVPVTKGVSGVLVLTGEFVSDLPIASCIKCGKCLEVCPMNLLPNFIGSASEKAIFDLAEKYGAMDCFECGCCTYICPAKRPLVQWIRIAKGEIGARRK